MNFSFLNPLFLIGIAAVALPVIAHLISRKSGAVKKFPAVRFLIASQGDASARSRLKDLLLLLLRACVIVLLVLVFAKPALFSFAPAGSVEPQALAVIVDNSFSMGYGDNFGRARQIASELIETLPDGSFAVVAPLVAGGEGRLAPSGDKQSLREGLGAVKLSSTFADNEKRLAEAWSALESAPGGSKEVVFITDLQKNGWQNEKIDRDWLRIIDVSGEAPSNRAVTGAETGYGKDSVTIGVSVSNFSDRPEESLLATLSAAGEELSAYLDIPPGGTVTNEFTIPGEYISGDESFDKAQDRSPGDARDAPFGNKKNAFREGSARIPHDKLTVDDTRYFVLSGGDDFNVLIVDGDPREDARLSETYYLARAAETISEISGARITVKDNDSFLGEKLSGYDLVFLANVGDISEASAKELGEFVSRGGTAVIFLGERVRASSYNALLKDLLPGELVADEERETKIAPGVETVFPRDVGERLGQVAIRKYIKTVPSPEAEVILGLEGGDPFMVKKSRGKGSVFLVTSTADPSWNNFSITTVFLPVVKGFLDIPGSAGEGRRNFTAGGAVPLDLEAGAGNAEVVSPSGKRYAIDTARAVFESAYEPGIYAVRESGKDSYKFAVNVDPRESNLAKLEIAPEKPAVEDTPGLVKVYRDIWRYFLWGAVMLFISEAVARALFS
ncbi:MAG: BatA and WFA domain-containing protein [Thermodesulfobacteriota bacterium]